LVLISWSLLRVMIAYYDCAVDFSTQPNLIIVTFDYLPKKIKSGLTILSIENNILIKFEHGNLINNFKFQKTKRMILN
jgi:hypothetical protein